MRLLQVWQNTEGNLNSFYICKELYTPLLTLVYLGNGGIMIFGGDNHEKG